MHHVETTENGSPQSNGEPPDWRDWPDVQKVSRRLKVGRQHVYRLAKEGKLRFWDGYIGSTRSRRFHPEDVARLVAAARIDADDDELDDDDLDDDELDDDDLEALRSDAPRRPRTTTERLLVRLLSEARILTTDSRKGQHEAFKLAISPSQELHRITLDALKAANERIRELETQLNTMHDERRDERKEDREWTLLERQIAASDARSEQFWKLLQDHGPMMLEQVLSSFASPKGPLATYLRDAPPEKQRKVIQAIEAVLEVEAERSPESAASEQKGG